MIHEFRTQGFVCCEIQPYNPSLQWCNAYILHSLCCVNFCLWSNFGLFEQFLKSIFYFRSFNLLLYYCMCMCVCMHVCACVCACMHACVCVRAQCVHVHAFFVVYHCLKFRHNAKNSFPLLTSTFILTSCVCYWLFSCLDNISFIHQWKCACMHTSSQTEDGNIGWKFSTRENLNKWLVKK